MAETWHSLWQRALIMDTETLGLERSAGMHELALFDLQSRELNEFILAPNYVKGEYSSLQDVTKLVSGPFDTHVGVYPNSWAEAMLEQAAAKGPVAPEVMADVRAGKVLTADALKAIETSNPWLHQALLSGKHPHLLSPPGPETVSTLASSDIISGGTRRSGVSTEDLFKKGGHLDSLIGGKDIWIANAAFEAKQVGAAMGSLQTAGIKTGTKHMLETAGESPDPFYVTGKAINEARVSAQMSSGGDWTPVWKAIINNPTPAGQTGVRDIQDLTRSFISYGRKLGLTASDNQYFGTGVELSEKLFGSLEHGPAGLMIREAHTAGLDASRSEGPLLEKLFKGNWTLQQVEERTPQGLKFLEQAAEGTGPLPDIANWFARRDIVMDYNTDLDVIKRLGRGVQDLSADNVTYQTAGYGGRTWMKQRTPDGGAVKIPRAPSVRIPLNNMDALVSHLETSGRYQGADIPALRAEMDTALAGATDRGQAATAWVHKKTHGVLASRIEQNADMIGRAKHQGLGALVSRQGGTTQFVRRALDNAGTIAKTAGGRGLAGAAALATAGFVWSNADGSSAPARTSPSLVTFNYQEWLARQEEFSGMEAQGPNDGMTQNGLMAAQRHRMTDFGSPYQGMVGVEQVFVDQELMDERQKWLRSQYHARHFDPDTGIMGIFGPFKRLGLRGRQGTTYIPPSASSDATGKYRGLRGDLRSVDVTGDNWNITVEDADTIMLKRGGIRGAVQSFFGMNRSYAFRLAGVDSTETSHGATSYHAPQPYAEAAAAALRSMVQGSTQVEVVFDPEQETYGRMMGAVVADGKNLNFEVVRRGLAAHLPFGKRSDSMIDYNALAILEKGAVQANRGMWQEPWAKAFYDFSESSGNRMTFNTLTKKSRIVENTKTMQILSLMEQAQSEGRYTSSMAVTAASIGQGYNFGADKVGPGSFSAPSAPHNSYINEMMRDQASFMKTKGTGNNQNKMSQRGDFGRLNSTMALDSMNTTNSVWNKRKLQAFEKYGSADRMRATRKTRMAQAQRDQNHQMFKSPINHHRM